MATKDKPNNKNLRALFSVICLCIIALGLIVYFSSRSTIDTKVNEQTTIVQPQTSQVQKRVTLRETTTQKAETSSEQTQTKTTDASTTSEKATMQQGDTNTPYKSFYKYPCEETVIAGYSEELVKNDTMNDYRAHTAVDFKCAKGAKVIAINDGLVLAVKNDSMLGKAIEIDHGGKLVARYCGLDSVNVSEGDYVTIGQTLATLGDVPFEANAQSHLHFETKLGNKYVNPLDVMGKSE